MIPNLCGCTFISIGKINCFCRLRTLFCCDHHVFSLLTWGLIFWVVAFSTLIYEVFNRPDYVQSVSMCVVWFLAFGNQFFQCFWNDLNMMQCSYTTLRLKFSFEKITENGGGFVISQQELLLGENQTSGRKEQKAAWVTDSKMGQNVVVKRIMDDQILATGFLWISHVALLNMFEFFLQEIDDRKRITVNRNILCVSFEFGSMGLDGHCGENRSTECHPSPGTQAIHQPHLRCPDHSTGPTIVSPKANPHPRHLPTREVGPRCGGKTPPGNSSNRQWPTTARNEDGWGPRKEDEDGSGVGVEGARMTRGGQAPGVMSWALWITPPPPLLQWSKCPNLPTIWFQSAFITWRTLRQ